MIIGPVIGGFIGSIYLPAPLFIAAGITLVAMLFGFFILPESCRQSSGTAICYKHLNPFLQFSHIFSIDFKKIIYFGFIFFLAMNGLCN